MPRKASKPSQNNLRAWREFYDMSQDALAKELGTKGNVIGQLEAGERELTEPWLRRFAVVFKTTPGFVLDHDPNTMNRNLLRAALDVPPERHEQAIRVLKALTE